MEDDDEIIMSPLSQTIASDGKEVDVNIYDDGEGGWILEVVDEHNNSTVWEDVFETDERALNEVRQTIKHEGILVFIGPKDETLQ